MDTINKSFVRYLQEQVEAYKNKGRDLKQFMEENKHKISQFQEEFDTLKQEVTDWIKKMKVEDFTDKRTDESKRKSPFI